MIEKIPVDLSHVLAHENQAETVALARALCPFAEQASDATMLICVALAEAKGDIQAVAEWLGYEKSRVYSHIRSNLSARIIKELAKHKLRGEGYLIAVCNLIDVVSSESQTGTARNNAAKAIIELAEQEEQKAPTDDTKDLNNMTLKELESYVDSIKKDMIYIHNPQS